MESDKIETDKLKEVPLESLLEKYKCEIPLPKLVCIGKYARRNSIAYKVGTVIQTKIEKDDMPKLALI